MTAASRRPARTASWACLVAVVADGPEGADVGGHGVEGLVDPQGLGAVVVVHHAHAASVILPPKALPRITSWTRGNTMAVSISAGERKNLRSSRSTMANIRFMAASPAGAA